MFSTAFAGTLIPVPASPDGVDSASSIPCFSLALLRTHSGLLYPLGEPISFSFSTKNSCFSLASAGEMSQVSFSSFLLGETGAQKLELWLSLTI